MTVRAYSAIIRRLSCLLGPWNFLQYGSYLKSFHSSLTAQQSNLSQRLLRSQSKHLFFLQSFQPCLHVLFRSYFWLFDTTLLHQELRKDAAEIKLTDYIVWFLNISICLCLKCRVKIRFSSISSKWKVLLNR